MPHVSERGRPSTNRLGGGQRQVFFVIESCRPLPKRMEEPYHVARAFALAAKRVERRGRRLAQIAKARFQATFGGCLARRLVKDARLGSEHGPYRFSTHRGGEGPSPSLGEERSAQQLRNASQHQEAHVYQPGPAAGGRAKRQRPGPEPMAKREAGIVRRHRDGHRTERIATLRRDEGVAQGECGLWAVRNEV